jgi:membrane protease YdiL (CAAX protease family)
MAEPTDAPPPAEPPAPPELPPAYALAAPEVATEPDSTWRLAPWLRRWWSPLFILLQLGAAIARILPAPAKRFLRTISIDQWRAIDADTPAPRATGRFYDHGILVICLTVAISLTLQEYIGDRGTFHKLFPIQGRDDYYELKSFAWWTGWRVLGYLVIPMLVLAAGGQRIRDYYVSTRGFFGHLPLYALLFALILPAVFLASRTDSFQHTYPFYRHTDRSTFDLLAWEAMYAAQFLSLEFFFRGFILHGLRHRIGANAVFVMIVPYCMIHFGKPLPETLGAIGAGLILGTLAMRTRSIWGGVVIHICVAVTMDVLAMRAGP